MGVYELVTIDGNTIICVIDEEDAEAALQQAKRSGLLMVHRALSGGSRKGQQLAIPYHAIVSIGPK